MSASKEKIRRYQQSDKMSTSYSSSSESSSEEETCMRDLKSIKEYMSDRRELASQLFKSVKADKIRIMLPQILKKIDLKELEELCANELSGMSKKRILSIINAQPMLDSSDTNETDDSDPSLEIISDADDCFTDESNKNKTKKTSKLKSKTRNDKKANDKTKAKVKSEAKDKPNKSVVKVEGEKDSKKEKEGDSLLDLLELEMRARAIRALIRKEEDVIPSTSEGQSNTCTKELEKQISKVKQRVISELSCQQLDELMKQTEEEDVVLVMQPTTVIELLSTDDEMDEQTQPNGTDGQTKQDGLAEKSTNNTSPAVPDQVQDSNKTDKTVEIEESSKSSTKNVDDDKTETNQKTLKEPTTEANEENPSKKEKSKKTKKKSPKKVRKKSDNPEDKTEETTAENKKEDVQETPSKTKDELQENKEKEEDSSVKKVEKKIIDNDLEIIDLDYYPDDIDDMEDSEGQKVTTPVKTSDETWASRYVRTDDVQSVIKESKIQSEIRKRLRERQRLNKINNSPTNVESTQTVEKIPVEEFNPIGSVQEYLALKATMSANNNEDTQSSLLESEACSSGKGSQVELSADDSSRTSDKDENDPEVHKGDDDNQHSKTEGDDEKCTKQNEAEGTLKSQCSVHESDDSNKILQPIDETNIEAETVNSDSKIVTDVKEGND